MNVKTEMDDEMKAVIADAAAAIEKVDNWSQDIRAKQDAGVRSHGGRFFTGAAEGWEFTVCDFSIEDQGFPKGSRGCDGAGRKGTTVLHLTRELAERAVTLAVAQNKGA